MHSYRTGAFWATPFFLVLLLGSTTPLRGAQGSPAPDRARKSVRGTLQSVDKGEGGVIMKSDAGERLAWRFSPAVIAEIAKLAPGAPMIVIYRQISSNEKRAGHRLDAHLREPHGVPGRASERPRRGRRLRPDRCRPGQ
ncbi:MAG: hypothetical protein DMF79_06780 [Acidobacteria bacterium]|nr:MAG: hypothetical protein DMF79_06780 [Acidobacteriota bacterium]